jgi:hypothetical protein
MSIQDEIRKATREGKRDRSKAYRGMTNEQRAAFREDRRAIRARQKELKKTVGEPSEYSRARSLTPEEQEEQRERMLAAIERRVERLEKRKAERAAQKLAEEEDNNFMAAYGKASGGMTKKYGYMGGGKVYGQPRKATYKAG